MDDDSPSLTPREWAQRVIDSADSARLHAASELAQLGVWTRGAITKRGTLTRSATNRLPSRELTGLIGVLDDRDRDVRAQIVSALGEWGGYDAAAAVAARLQLESDETVVLHCVTALRTIGGEPAREGLQTVLQHGTSSAQHAALSAIEELATATSHQDLETPTPSVVSERRPGPRRTRAGVSSARGLARDDATVAADMLRGLGDVAARDPYLGVRVDRLLHLFVRARADR